MLVIVIVIVIIVDSHLFSNDVHECKQKVS